MIGEQRTGHLAGDGVVISMVSHEHPKVTIDGKPAQLAVITEDGTVIASGQKVADEIAAVVVNSYRAMWIGKGHLRVYSEPIMPIATVGRPDEAANVIERRKVA